MTKKPLVESIAWPPGTIFTIGHSTLPIEHFVAVLNAYRVECLADVRTIPRSRRNPQFNADALEHPIVAVLTFKLSASAGNA